MINQEHVNFERDKQDAKSIANFLKDARIEGRFDQLVGLLLSGYINGVNDTCRALKAAQAV